MDETQIIDAIRRGIREPQPRTVSDETIQDWIADAVRALGLEIKSVSPGYFEKAALASSLTHVFDRPSDCQTLLRVWDIGTSAAAITEATNASPIVVTAVGHGFEDDDIMFVSGVGGNTAANGTFKITYIDADSFSLDGTTGNADYTSGGYAAAWPASGDDAHVLLDQIPPGDSTLDDESRYFMRALKITVDDVAFENDLLLEYTYSPSEIGDIPAELHGGLVAFAVMNLITVPGPDDPQFNDLAKSRGDYAREWSRVLGDVRKTMRVAKHINHQPPGKGYIGAL